LREIVGEEWEVDEGLTRMKIIWVHNNADRRSGSFMWDVHDFLAQTLGIRVDMQLVPLMRSLPDVLWLLKSNTSALAKFDIVHGQYGSLVGFLATWHRGCRIVSLRGSDTYRPQGAWRPKLTGRLRQVLTYLAALRAHQVLVMSEAMHDYVTRWPFIARNKILVLTDPTSEIFWDEPLKDVTARARATEFKVVAASIRGDSPIKRLHLVTEAVQLCQSVGLNVSLKKLSGVTREEVKAAIIASDAVALASTHEGWPNIIKEGLILGKPFIATDVSDLKAVARMDPRCKIVAPTAIEFAFAFVDGLLAKVLKSEGTALIYVRFHPLSAALKHAILYHACAGSAQGSEPRVLPE
jgi:glycosyltransferase involved in cell wall biosynthesis